MKAIIIEEETFDRIFDELCKDLEIGAAEAIDGASEGATPRHYIKSAVEAAKRKWVYALRTTQARLRKER
jgi:hypothetical protein